ncbi:MULTISPECIES: 23S rRNA (uracil(1939)-C(5))-methyltransferase RlmD [Bacillus amyloliquefaciens group]|uniref:23S rRNA (uracil(1939)-C(5))-methyltransferase RlmD n=1 Tax=Bacillus amyloliquefaciens group TaxID=1938374 RepID=UPI0013634D54|nr:MULTISPECIES: 23S rRNA (uracil(1939)-C(5))-methyltransferase RlmD [Bacillus amyloliquefaciens group]MBO3649433.1 23S rRNA (uracil(1939)-C(5))-methyltransferase RlmD [Bacillus amyloliquefaciens]MCJ2176039.1 23S rRNA (uracil(1939)-C(5))-methyltransferase RlmD [Bacillus amyloliquefaciens]MCR4350746.1 23S rRNA (uracil(1939)-C(5))-methyltransferase RlmD [Bacillus amyloliquefaciens]MCR4359449.1 23S rRNA (uracil(1939)-C(5))-methyltransferase RlmD [Bacillus amyloliquefaciens]MEC1482635.1 23S rRNA (
MKMKPPIEKNEYYDVTFEDLTHEGAGVAKVQGFPIFVPNALPEEKAQIKVTRVKKGFAFGRLIELKEESPHRTDAQCPIYKQCGGCQLQHMTYEGQLLFKQKQVKDVLERIGKLDLSKVTVHPTLGMEDPWNYRNKAQVPVGEREGGLVAGFYQQRSHDIIDMSACLIQQSKNDEAVQAVKDICTSYGVKAYNEERHKGWLRHIMVRYGVVTGEMMIVFITRTSDFPHKAKIIEDITTQFPHVKSIVQNINPNKTNVIFGNETNVIWGEEYIYDLIGDVKFAISARSFYQVNPEQTKVLYDKALEYAELQGEENVIDAYCGIGTISLFLAKQAKKVYGVEIVPEAIEDAKRNAELNGITNAEFAVGEAETVIPKWYKEGITADTLVVDPPRKGCDEALLRTIIDMKPKRVVYVSCNPGTLARDLRVLEDGGYQTLEVQPVDMFPHTNHVECVAVLELREGN